MAKESRVTAQKINSLVWDCGSSLHDSYELNTFKRQLDDAVVASRSLSMPHLPAPPPPPLAIQGPKKRARLPKLLHKLFFKVLRLRSTAARSAPFGAYERYRMVDEYSYGGGSCSSWSGALTSIPEEGSEKGSPEIGPSVIRKTRSERFVSTTTTMVQLEVVL